MAGGTRPGGGRDVKALILGSSMRSAIRIRREVTKGGVHLELKR